MNRKSYSEEQIAILKEAEGRGGYARVGGVPQARHAKATFYAWKRKYAGMEVSDAKKLRAWRRRTGG